MSGSRLALGLAAVAAVTIGAASVRTGAATPEVGLRSVEDFAGIENKRERSLALFAEVGKVIQHPRCLNCHPAGERPSQGDAMTPHNPWVVRGTDGFGAPGMRCATCHSEANFDPARIPGAPKWHLAPIEMAWQGKSLGEICRQIKDHRRNGGMDMARLIHHMGEDELVGWGWHPGAGRTPAPGTQKQFGELFKAWTESGTACPKA
ncbi:Isoquinoline 1-oxidoreductase subunit [Sphingomonas oleivorans]|uniref:Isoquinoline 1-oxidoreductase subunit n=1 Tax=Sphingomonas oleivorans TaxID=1735121 RepID=A0A2T5G189_9SPHN|nr:Isoquinoline 1-oxidoreductase subunit [Sphingomonas oleivorans]PTQ12916.1 Isoquinoline 1-oxidoreductase subunit [Sphingomonas oleivorans]